MKNFILVLLFLAGSLDAAPKPVQRHPLGWRSAPRHAKGLTQLTSHPLFRAAPLPPAASVEATLPPVYDQLNLGSCVANAGAAAFDYQWKARTGKFVSPSRLDLYQSCLKHDGNYPRDSGTYTSSALWVMLNKGLLLERKWPYKPENLAANPTPAGRQRATYAAVKAYDVSNTDGGYSVKQAISNLKVPVLVGGYVYEDVFHVTASDPFIPMPRGPPVGGHEILVVGYDDNLVHNGQKGFARIRNSWGPRWGGQRIRVGFLRLRFQSETV